MTHYLPHKTFTALPLALLLMAPSGEVMASLLKTTTVQDGPDRVVITNWFDTSTEANAACEAWALPKGLPCGGHGGPGANTGQSSAGWYPSNPSVYYKNYGCSNGYTWDPGLVNCVKRQTAYSFSTPPAQCSAKASYGNPIEPLNGRKVQDFDLGIGPRNMRLKLAYDSLRVVLAKQQSQLVNALGAMPAVGGEWAPSWTANIYRKPDQEPGKYVLQYFTNSGSIVTFQGTSMGVGAIFSAISDPEMTLTIIDQWETMRVRDPANGVIALFERATPDRFSMIQRWTLDGSKVSWRLSSPGDRLYVDGHMINGMPIAVGDQFGQWAAFQYQLLPASGNAQIDAKVTKITSTSGEVNLGYTPEGKLDSLTWQDGHHQTLVLESTANGVGPLLTGVIDEDDKRFSTFSYDADGYAVSTERAGGTSKYTGSFTTRPELVLVEGFDAAKNIYTRSFQLTQPSVAEVTGPNGQRVSINSASVQGVNVPVSQSQPAGSGCAASTRSQSFDAKGNLDWAEDFKGFRSCFANDLARNLSKGRVEGLATGTACTPLLVDGAVLPAGSRKISTAWHPVWRLQTKVAEPRRLLTRVYNGQPDPFNNNVVASCAPSTALLPDGSAIAVLCRQVEQATTDLDGSKGFAATLDTVASVPKREEKWTYDQYGRMLTYRDPRNNLTTYAYYSNTTADHTPGDLETITNAKGQVTRFTKYNSAGQWLEMTDPNSVLTVRTFDARQRLKTTLTSGSRTSYDYWPTGLLKSVTFPDTSSLTYGYDDAHRLKTITDEVGNSVTYTLDDSGIRTGEIFKSPTGVPAKTLIRSLDALNRIEQVTGKE